MSLEQTPEFLFSQAMQPACNRVLCAHFGVPESNIERFTTAHSLFILDKEHAIDMRIQMPNGTHLLGQEKTLRHQFYKYRTFTVEFWQNRYAKPPEPGEFFKIASQFYLHGYGDESGQEFVEWKIIDILRFIFWLKDCPKEKLAMRTKPAGPSRAAFLAIDYDKLPQEIVLAQWRRGGY